MEFVTDSSTQGYLVLFYGPPGIGKSTEAALAEDPVFLDLEGGLAPLTKTLKQKHNVELRRSSKIETFNQFIEWLRFAATSPHKTVVIDTVTKLEEILCGELVSEYNDTHNKDIESIAQIPYGQGGEMLAARWSYVMKVIQKTQQECGKNVILVGHQTIQKVEDPTAENYDRFSVDIHKKALGVVVNNVDAVFFCRLETHVRNKETDKTKKKAVTTGERIIHTMDRVSYLAKNRFDICDDVPMGGHIFKKISEGLTV